jgi:D-3-phosphoglycerate dehydrogenase
VIGHVGSVLGRNAINIANFSLGRTPKVSPGQEVLAVAVVEVDALVPEGVIAELKANSAVRIARPVEFAA